MNIAGRLRAVQMDASRLRAEYGCWRNIPTERPIAENELNRMSDCIDSLLSQTHENKNMKPLNCKCCGAPINRKTMTCEYCGVQYGKGIDEH